jgi:hypothetical protein
MKNPQHVMYLAGKKRCSELHLTFPWNPSVPSLTEQKLQLRKMKRPELDVELGARDTGAGGI